MTKANPPTLPISTSKSAALARVLDLVPKGYAFYVAGNSPADKLPKLLEKFHDLYGIGCSPAQRSLRKSRGQANAILVVFQRQTDGHLASESDVILADKPEGNATQSQRADHDVYWLLLATPGTGPIHQMERLLDVRAKPRLCWLGYELLQLPKRGGASWTWRRAKEEMAGLYAQLSEQFNARRHDLVADSLLRISRQPGFSGVRSQAKELFNFVRSKGYKNELPTLFFLQKIAAGKRVKVKT